jgi:hypothetical protein
MSYSPRQLSLAILCLSVTLLASCSSYEGSIKPAESLDEQTGMTVGSLEKPILLLQNGQSALTPESRVSSAYLGPVEWDNAGTITYALWVHLVPANDWQFEDIKAPGSVALVLEGGSLQLKVEEPPGATRGPYRPVASWGQTAYFQVDLDTLKRMGSSPSFGLVLKAAGGAPVRFVAAPEARDTLLRFLHARGY